MGKIKMIVLIILLWSRAALAENDMKFNCNFNMDEPSSMDFSESEGSGVRSWRWTRWDDNGVDPIVPYYFSGYVTKKDRELIKEQMNLIESKTCIKFKETDQYRAPRHRMKIQVGSKTCPCCFDGGVTPNQEVLFESTYQLADIEQCDRSGGVLHELMHALGAMHTQQRVDRDEYIIYNKNCVEWGKENQFKKHKKNDMNFSIPYRCDSIMHYGYGQFSKGCATMRPHPSNPDCIITRYGYEVAIEEDWEMLNKYHC